MDTYTLELKRTPWGTPWYGNYGGDILRTALEQMPRDGVSAEQAEEIRAQLAAGVEQQWANLCEQKKMESRGTLGVSDIYRVVPVRGGARVDAA